MPGTGRRNPLRRAFGDRVRDGRQRLKLGQDAFALKAGVHRTYVAGIEAGRRNPTLEMIARLARGLELDAGELVRGLQDVPTTGT